MRVKTTKDLGNLVHDRRKALGISQAELATRTGVSRLWVNQVESGHGGAAVAKVLQLLSALGITMDLDLAPGSGAAEVVSRAASSEPVRPATVTATTRGPRPQVSGGAAMKMAMPKARPVNKKGR
jgi:y4mF family transcriptional regulator